MGVFCYVFPCRRLSRHFLTLSVRGNRTYKFLIRRTFSRVFSSMVFIFHDLPRKVLQLLPARVCSLYCCRRFGHDLPFCGYYNNLGNGETLLFNSISIRESRLKYNFVMSYVILRCSYYILFVRFLYFCGARCRAPGHFRKYIFLSEF